MPDDNTQGQAVGGQGQAGQQSGTSGSVLSPQGGQQGQGTQAPQGDNLGWRANIPEQYRSNKVFENIKGKDLNEALPTLLKNYVEAQSYIGGAVKIPKPTDPPEKWSEFYKKVGRPDSPDGYQFEPPDTGGVNLEEGRVKSFLDAAHKIGLTNSQVQKVMEWYGQDMQSTQAAYRQSQEQSLEGLRQQWGPSFERKAILAQRAAKEYGGPELLKLLDDTGLGNNPVLIEFFADVGAVLAEDGFISGTVEGAPGPTQAKQQITEIMSNPEHLYHAKFAGKPGHKEAVEKMRQLHVIAYGD